MSKELDQFQFAGKTVKLIVVTGEVTYTEQRSDTHVSGSIESVTQGWGGRGSISSEVIVTRHLRVKTDDGKQKSFSLTADLHVAPGDRVSVFSLTNNAFGSAFRIYNHTTDKTTALPFQYSQQNGVIVLLYLAVLVGSFFVGLWPLGVLMLVCAGPILVWNKKHNENLIKGRYAKALDIVKAES